MRKYIQFNIYISIFVSLYISWYIYIYIKWYICIMIYLIEISLYFYHYVLNIYILYLITRLNILISVHTDIIGFLILLKLTKTWLYLPFSELLRTKKYSVWFHLNLKMTNRNLFRLIQQDSKFDNSVCGKFLQKN